MKPPVGEPGSKVRLVLLNGNDPYVGWVGMPHPFEPPLESRDEPYPTRLAPWTAFIVVGTGDAEKACGAATKIDSVIMTGQTQRGARAMLSDTTGVAVEINQLLD